MKFIKPKDIDNLYETLENGEQQYLLAGVTYINLNINNGNIRYPNIFYIIHLK